MSKFKKKYILLAVIICILLLFQNKVFALSQEEAGQYIANYARNFYDKHATDVTYCSDGSLYSHRAMAYKDETVDGKLHLECMGFASYVVYKSLHLSYPCVLNGNHGFVHHFGYGHPGDYTDECGGHGFRLVQSGLNYTNVCDYAKPGDLLVNKHHVMVYVGDGKIVHSMNYPLYCDTVTYYGEVRYGGSMEEWGVLRITEEAAASVTNPDAGGDLKDLGSGGFLSGIGGKIGGLISDVKDWIELDEDLDKFKVVENPPEGLNFYYKGLATEKSKETITPTKDNDENDRITKFLSWVVSMMVTGVRGVFVGWANIIQIGATQYIAEMAGEETSFNLKNAVMDAPDELKKQMEESLTVEKIVYNKVPVFDINVFSSTGVGAKDSLSGIVKTMVANWYYVVRTGSIIVLLIVLIYLGVKMAISTSVESKATFKEMLFNWLVSFIVVYFMHYIILFGIQMNETFVKILANMGEQLNLYQEVRTLTYSTEVWKGIVATILYLALVWYLIKFIIIYFRRLFITVILIILAPMTAAKYAYDKIKGGKSDTSLMLWVKEFSFSVMMQTVHALTYTIFVSISLNMATEGNGVLAKIIISLVFFNFMVKGEKLIKDILKLVGSEGGSDFGDVSIKDIQKYAGWPTLLKRSRKLQLLRRLASPVTSLGGVAINFAGKQIENAYVKIHKSLLADEYDIDFGKTKKSDIDKKIEEKLRQQYRMKVSTVKSSIKTGIKTLGGMGQVFLSIPIFVTDSPVVGLENMLMGLNTIWHAAGEPIKGYKKFKAKKEYKSTSKSKSMIRRLISGDYLNGSVEQRKWKKILNILKHTGLAGITGGANLVYLTLKKYFNVNGQKLDIINNFTPEQIRLLIEAKKSEQRLMGLLKQTRFREFKGYNSEEASELEKSLAKSYEERLAAIIEDSQKTFKTKKLEEAIRQHMKKTRKNKFEYR